MEIGKQTRKSLNKVIIYRTNDIYHHHFYKVVQIALKNGSEKSVVKILFKVNILASLYNSYEGILRNGVPTNTMHIESYLLYVKKIVLDVNSLLEVQKKKKL